MFEEVSDKLSTLVRNIRGLGSLNEKNISESLRSIRRVLLEADVNYKVVKDLVKSVETQSLGQITIKSVTPGQQVVKIFFDELVRVLGGTGSSIQLSSMPPTVIMMTGLQGSGKTTFCVKLAKHFQKKGKRAAVVPLDPYRPAAVKQLQDFAAKAGVDIIPVDHAAGVVAAGEDGLKKGKDAACDVLILDTAGRLHVDDEMMAELEAVKATVKPHEILYVADGMTGQDAVNSASAFARRLSFDGVILTKMDGDARGGAALSMRAVTGKPIKFIGTGERVDALESFYPDRLASRIMGMGDIVSLVEKAEQTVTRENARKLEEKLRKQEFNLEDFYEQLQQIKQLGPLDQLLDMIPFGGAKLKGLKVEENALVRIEAIINSMTREERYNPRIINGSRKKRIARGSGTNVEEINRLLKQFGQMQKMFKNMSRFGMKRAGKMFFS